MSFVVKIRRKERNHIESISRQLLTNPIFFFSLPFPFCQLIFSQTRFSSTSFTHNTVKLLRRQIHLPSPFFEWCKRIVIAAATHYQPYGFIHIYTFRDRKVVKRKCYDEEREKNYAKAHRYRYRYQKSICRWMIMKKLKY